MAKSQKSEQITKVEQVKLSAPFLKSADGYAKAVTKADRKMADAIVAEVDRIAKRGNVAKGIMWEAVAFPTGLSVDTVRAYDRTARWFQGVDLVTLMGAERAERFTFTAQRNLMNGVGSKAKAKEVLTALVDMWDAAPDMPATTAVTTYVATLRAPKVDPAPAGDAPSGPTTEAPAVTEAPTTEAEAEAPTAPQVAEAERTARPDQVAERIVAAAALLNQCVRDARNLGAGAFSAEQAEAIRLAVDAINKVGHLLADAVLPAAPRAVRSARSPKVA